MSQNIKSSLDLNRKISVLIPDGGPIITLSVLNCLSEYKNIDIHLIHVYKKITGLKYSNKISSYTFYNRTDDEKDYINFIKHEIGKKNIDILLPIYFESIRVISKFRGEFKALNINLLSTSVKASDIVNDKWELYKYLQENKIPTPKTFNCNSSFENIDFPLLAKHKIGHGGRGTKLIKSEDELYVHLGTSDNKKYVFQEFIDGYDIGCSVLCKEGEILAFTIQRGLSYSSIPFTPPIAIEFLYNKELYKQIDNLIKSLNWTGVANFDLRYDEVEKNFKVLEVNPRFWQSVQGSAMVGVNFPYLYCLTSLGVQYEIPVYRFEKYAYNRGLIKFLRSKFNLSKCELTIQTNFSIINDILDPLPKIIIYSNKLLIKIKNFIVARF